MPPAAPQLQTPDPAGPPDPAARLRRTERWLIPAAILGLLIIAALAWYSVNLANPEIIRDGVVTYDEAAFWARTKALHGLTLAQAAQAIDGRIEPLGSGRDAARVPIQPLPGSPTTPWLELRLDAGRIVEAKLHRQ